MHCILALYTVLVILSYQLHILEGSQTGDVRLVGGATPNEGRVEIFYNGTWGTVCDDYWDDYDASVVCRQLGIESHGVATCCANFGEGVGTIWLDNVYCSGSEASLSLCTTAGWGVHNCAHHEDAGVICRDVRLSGGSTPNEGRVEILNNGIWGTVCDNNWDDNDASVVCRQLGMGSHAFATCCANFGEGVGTIWLDNVYCSGTEVTLSQCTTPGWGVHNCDHYKDAGVVCRDVRLVGGSTPNEGRVEVYYNGIWGTVCDNYWSDIDAKVVCRQLGIGNRGKATYSAFFGEGVGTIWMDRVNCVGDELSLTECTSSGWGVHSCGHHQDAGVYCQETAACLSSPCLNDARCVEQSFGYMCICQPGYQGENCENDANLCTIGSCLNGGTCVNHPDGTRCICDLGYYGDNCQYDANLCTMGSCLNGGTCINQLQGTRCICDIGYYGDNCEYDANLCTKGSCHNGGTCVNQPNGTRCICDLGYYGDNCEYEYTLTCNLRVCDNGATCVDQPDGIKCICPAGYHGNYCEYAPIEKNWVNVLGIISMVLCSVLIIAVVYLMYELKWKQIKTPPAPTPSTMDTSGVHHSSAKPTNQVRYVVGSDNPAISGEDSIYEINHGIYENSAN